MFIKFMLILILFGNLSDTFKNKKSNKKALKIKSKLDFYSNLTFNFELNNRNKNEINELQKLVLKVNEYEKYTQRDSIEIDPNLFDRSAFSFVTGVVRNVVNVVGFTNFTHSIREGVSTSLTCFGCHVIMNLIVSPSITKEALSFAIFEVCVILRLSTIRVCRGIVDQMTDQIEFIRLNTRLTSNEMCGVLLGVQCYVGKSENLYWRINIPPKFNKNVNSTIMQINQTLIGKDSGKIYQTMQITDIHLDPIYFTLSESQCGEPLCCRNSDGIAIKRAAGYWGTYPCDIPFHTVGNTFTEMVRNARNVDLWYWTGDIVPHDIWEYTRESNILNTQIITNFLKKFTNKTVICAIGNHESVPVNSFPPPSMKNEFSISWLYEELANQWSGWLTKEALETLKYGGYYSMSIRPGFRVIVVNTNYCARLNFWTLYDPQDPADHLKWIIQELLQAEDAGDNVHIVGHIPPDNRECTQAWLYNFLAIVERFKDTIVGQFYGHTHADELRVLYSNQNYSQPIGFEFVNPSLTTYEVFNPAYRIFTTNQNGVITDVDTFFFNLTQANQKSKSTSEPELPVWYYEYSMARNYSMTDFSYVGFNNLVKQFIDDDYYMQLYYLFYHRYSDSMQSPFCDNDCKVRLIDDIVIGNPYMEKMKSILTTG